MITRYARVYKTTYNIRMLIVFLAGLVLLGIAVWLVYYSVIASQEKVYKSVAIDTCVLLPPEMVTKAVGKEFKIVNQVASIYFYNRVLSTCVLEEVLESRNSLSLRITAESYSKVSEVNNSLSNTKKFAIADKGIVLNDEVTSLGELAFAQVDSSLPAQMTLYVPNNNTKLIFVFNNFSEVEFNSVVGLIREQLL